MVYGATVASFPQAIFVLAACFLFMIVLLLAGVWPASTPPYFPLNTADPDADVEAHSFNAGLNNSSITVDEQESLSYQQTDRGMNKAGSYQYNGVGNSPPRTRTVSTDVSDVH